MKLQIYRKPTHTDQYLNFNFHHPVVHKLSGVRTLLERSKSLVTDSEDKEKEDTHVEEILRTCGYAEWSFRKVKRQNDLKTVQKKKAKQHHPSVKRPLVVIPYVELISEAVATTMRKYDVHVAMRPWKTLEHTGTPQRQTR